MPLFIKIERFKSNSAFESQRIKKDLLIQHREWVENLSKNGINISSGYLVNSKRQPGGGGILILESESYEDAQSLINQDPIIKSKLVDWSLHEWTFFAGKKLTLNEINEDFLS